MATAPAAAYLITVLSLYGGELQVIPFGSMEACEAARTTIATKIRAMNPTPPANAKRGETLQMLADQWLCLRGQ